MRPIGSSAGSIAKWPFTIFIHEIVDPGSKMASPHGVPFSP